jgi:hypothetical protein
VIIGNGSKAYNRLNARVQVCSWLRPVFLGVVSIGRKLRKRCALRAIGTSGFCRVRFRMSGFACGQGRGRTADLPLFRRTLVPTELPDLGAMQRIRSNRCGPDGI